MKFKILYFIGGVVAGSVATFFITKKICDDQKEQEIADIKKAYADRPLLKVVKKEVSDMGIKFTTESIDPKDIVARNNKIKADLITSSNICKKEKYNVFSKPPKAIDIHNGIDEGEDLEVSLPENYLDGVEVTPPSEGMSDKPYIISPYQFINEEQYFDKITLELFDDGTLANPITDEIIENKIAAIGYDVLTNFEKYTTEDDETVYVRNERQSTDYEVIRQHRPFVILDEDYS